MTKTREEMELAAQRFIAKRYICTARQLAENSPELATFALAQTADLEARLAEAEAVIDHYAIPSDYGSVVACRYRAKYPKEGR